MVYFCTAAVSFKYNITLSYIKVNYYYIVYVFYIIYVILFSFLSLTVTLNLFPCCEAVHKTQHKKARIRQIKTYLHNQNLFLFLTCIWCFIRYSRHTILKYSERLILLQRTQRDKYPFSNQPAIISLIPHIITTFLLTFLVTIKVS